MLCSRLFKWGGDAVVSAAEYSSANREFGGSSLTVSTDDPLG